MKKRKKLVGRAYLFQTVSFVVIISVLPLLIIGLFTYFRVTKAVNQEIITTNKRVVALTLNNVESIMDQLKNSCRTLSENRSFHDFHNLPKPLSWYEDKTSFDTDEELRDLYQYISLKGNIFDKLMSVQMSADFIHSIYFIDFHKDIVLTSNRENMGISSFYDAGLFDQLSRQQGNTGIVLRELKDSEGLPLQVLSFYQGARYLGDSQVFVLNIAADDLHDYIYQYILENTNDQLIVMQGKQVILPNTPEASILAESISTLLETNGEAVLQSTVDYNQTSFLVTGIYSPKLYWWFISVSAAKEMLKTEQYVASTIIFIPVYMMAVIFLCVFLWSIRWYRPVKKMISEIQNATDTSPRDSIGSGHELLFIGENLQLAFTERRELRQRIASMLPSYRSQYLFSLLKGDMEPGETFTADMAAIDAHITKENPAVCMVQIANRESAPLESITQNIENSIAIVDSISNILREYTPHFACLSEQTGRFVCIVNIIPADSLRLFHLADAVRCSLAVEYQVCCYIGLSRIHEDIWFLPDCYKEAQQALLHSTVFTEQSIVHIEEILPNPSPSKKQSIHLVHLPQELFASIRAGDEEPAILALLTSFKAIVSSNEGYSFGEIAVIFQHIVSKLFDLCEEVGLSDNKVYEQLFAVGQELRNRNELVALEKIKLTITLLSQYCKDTLSPRNEDRIAKALDFIHNHYGASDLSLARLADEIGLNADYLGRLFKERTAQTFVEYLTGYRIRKSKELLKATKQKVKDVSAAVGYNNVNYFIKVFRDCVGITPRAYQQRERGK